MFNQARDIFPKNPVPYYEDGDPDMYTPENLVKRESLKQNEIVREAIDTFMEEQFEMAKNKNMCTRESYLKVFTNIAFILKPGFEADELQSAIKADWDTDSQDPVQQKAPVKREGDDGEEISGDNEKEAQEEA